MNIIKGEDKTIQVVLWKRPISSNIKNPENLNGKTVKVKYKAGALITADATVIDPSLGKVTFEIDKVNSEKLAAGLLSFDVEVTTTETGKIEKWKFVNAIKVIEREK